MSAGWRSHAGPVSAGMTMGLLRLALAAVFIYAGASKLIRSPVSFADNIAGFRVLPIALVIPFALLLPVFEGLLGFILLINRPRRLGAFGILCISVVFLIALLSASIRGLTVDCGCFGSGPDFLSMTPLQRTWWDLARDLGLAAAALLLYRHDVINRRPQPCHE